jgi:hypothetical protein
LVVIPKREDDVGDVTHRLLHPVDVADRAGELAGHEALHGVRGVPDVDAAVLAAAEAKVVLLQQPRDSEVLPCTSLEELCDALVR